MSDTSQQTRRAQIRRLRRIAQRATALYAIEPASLALLAHVFNTTFLITDSGGARYVLHIILPEDDPLPEVQRRARVESELWWLERLQTDLHLPVPRVLRTRSGEGVVDVGDGDIPPRLCTLFHWVEGRFIRERLTPAHLYQVGGVTARLHNHSTSLTVPTGFDRPTVDRADPETEESVVRLFRDHHSLEAADLMQKVLRQVRAAQEELGEGPDVFGLIHADIHQKNYLFDRGEVRLIDFGDCGWGHYLYDLAVTIDQLDSRPRLGELRTALLAGYREIRNLSPAHEGLIDAFVMLRDVQDLTWVLEERDNPVYARWTAQIGEGLTLLERQLTGRE